MSLWSEFFVGNVPEFIFDEDDGIVHVEFTSNKTKIRIAMPLKTFRTGVAAGQTWLDDFDARRRARVTPLRGIKGDK